MNRDPMQLIYLIALLGTLIALYFGRRRPPKK